MGARRIAARRELRFSSPRLVLVHREQRERERSGRRLGNSVEDEDARAGRRVRQRAAPRGTDDHLDPRTGERADAHERFVADIGNGIASRDDARRARRRAVGVTDERHAMSHEGELRGAGNRERRLSRAAERRPSDAHGPDAGRERQSSNDHPRRDEPAPYGLDERRERSPGAREAPLLEPAPQPMHEHEEACSLPPRWLPWSPSIR